MSKLDSVLITNKLMDSAYSLKSLIEFKNYDNDTLVAGKYTLQKIWSANTLVNQIDHFADVVSKKVKPKVNGNDGLISLKIFAAITKSAKTGKKVRV